MRLDMAAMANMASAAEPSRGIVSPRAIIGWLAGFESRSCEWRLPHGSSSQAESDLRELCFSGSEPPLPLVTIPAQPPLG
jgi:hypothetical protein